LRSLDRSGYSPAQFAASIASTSVTSSCPEALVACMPRGRPEAPASATSFVLLLRLVDPTDQHPSWRHKSAVDEAPGEAQCTVLFWVVDQCSKNRVEQNFFVLLLEASMTCLVRRVAFWQVTPWCSGTQNSQDAVEYIPRISPRSTATVGPANGIGDQHCKHCASTVQALRAVRWSDPATLPSPTYRGPEPPPRCRRGRGFDSTIRERLLHLRRP
jgi:hypothetical protein